MRPITLIPLSAPEHVSLLQAVYEAVPLYWRQFQQPGAAPDQAAQELAAVSATPGRAIMGILHPMGAENSNAELEMIGMVDFRLHYPHEGAATVGLLLVAQPYQRQGIGRQCWLMLEQWLARSARMKTAHAAVEQFNTVGLKFFLSMGFSLTGGARRLRVGDRFIRLLDLEKPLAQVFRPKSDLST